MAATADQGPGAHKAVSVLSPLSGAGWLEQEMRGARWRRNGPDDAEKFVQEVIWRGYLKLAWSAARRFWPA